MINRIAALAALFVSLLVAVPIVAPEAAQAAGNCPNGNFCGFVGTSYSTSEGAEFNPSSTGCENVVFPNSWSSMWNSSGRAVRLYKGANCSGTNHLLSNGAGDPRFSTSATWSPYENNIESFRWS